MKIISEKPNREGKGKYKLLIEIDQDDSIIIDEAINTLDQKGAFDKDDRIFIARLNHVKDISHKVWALLHPS